MTTEEQINIIPLEVDNRLLPEEISSFAQDVPSSFSIFNQNNSNVKDKVFLSISGIEEKVNVSNDNTVIFPSGHSFTGQDDKNISIHQFKPIHPNTVYTNEKGTFGYIRCQLITTFFFGSLNFSQFTNPYLIENDPRYDLKFLYKGNNTDCEGNSFSLYDEFSLNNISVKELKNFLHALNKFFQDSKYISLTKSFQIRKTMFNILYYFLWLIMLCIIGFAAYYLYSNRVNNFVTLKTIFWIIIGCCIGGVILIIIGLVFIHFKLNRMKMLLIEKETILRIKDYKAIYQFIDDWNSKLFSLHKISMWIPITLCYVMFNMSKHESIQLIGHTVDEIKTKKLF